MKKFIKNLLFKKEFEIAQLGNDKANSLIALLYEIADRKNCDLDTKDLIYDGIRQIDHIYSQIKETIKE